MDKPLTEMSMKNLLEMLEAGVSPASTVEIVRELRRRQNAFRKQVEDALDEVKNDERLGYPTATVFENAPLALVQCGLENQRRTLNFVLKALDVMEDEL